jgi:glycosyltransferase involved in cell wall biosynthesis
LKILYHHRINSKDGQAVHMDELIHAFEQLGHEVLVVGPKSFARASFGHNPAFVNALKRAIPQFAYEILELGYNVLAFARLNKACSQFQPDFLYERHNLYTLAGAWLARLRRLPRLLEVNAPLADERAANDGLAFPALAHRLEYWSWRNATFALPVTHVLAQYFERAAVDPDRICVIANAINPEIFGAAPAPENAKAALGLSDKLVIGFTGFMREWHGLDAIVDWLSDGAPPSAHLVLIGEGPALPGLKSQADRLGVSDRITFAGLVDRDRIAEQVAAFDIAIVPKCVEYCSPLKLFEYMALGKAIIAPDQANIREILVDRQSTLLCKSGDRRSLYAALNALASAPELRKSLGDNAKETIAARRLNWRENAMRITSLAQSAIDSGRRASAERLSPTSP